MTAVPKSRMTVDEYLTWAAGHPGRYELKDGGIFAMSPGSLGHAERKGAIHAALLADIRTRGLPCYALPDGATVRIDDATAYEPDAIVTAARSVRPPRSRYRTP
ncbi:MAG TPA: Uma2 family endonuclease [Xanthobacteraceae bacterium]|nr:Uma2 family endonuclease [Xanthobacteraceae bacterium]